MALVKGTDGARAYQKGMDVLPCPRGVPSYKRCPDELQGAPVGTIWDVKRLIQATSGERVGFPTQESLALLDSII